MKSIPELLSEVQDAMKAYREAITTSTSWASRTRVEKARAAYNAAVDAENAITFPKIPKLPEVMLRKT